MTTSTSQSIRIANELGQLQTAPGGPAQFSYWGKGKRALLIGLGPDPQSTLQCFLEHFAWKASDAYEVFYLEAPGLEVMAGPAWKESIPGSWKRLDQEDLLSQDLSSFSLSFYKPGLRLFPSFYGPLRARIQATSFQVSSNVQIAERTAIIAGDDLGLLVSELHDALSKSGFRTLQINHEAISSNLPAIIQKYKPELFVSINLAGYDPLGEIYYLLNELGVTCASWLVDNPWHILSGLRSPYWKKMHLFVTDASFLPEMKALGASSTHHLPLAANPELFRPRQANPAVDIVFAGRSEFPNRSKFFSAAKVDEELLAKAKELTLSGQICDFNWWVNELAIKRLWPGQEVRKAGIGAETCSLTWRRACVRAALQSKHSFKLYGNPEWLEQIPELRGSLYPPQDYYTSLPSVYADARIVLSTTSLLLPEGLNQRHFDAWMAGSICMTDMTPGLEIFPPELVQPIAYSHPEEIQDKVKELLNNPDLQAKLKAQWSGLILSGHTYQHRIQTMLAIMGIPPSA